MASSEDGELRAALAGLLAQRARRPAAGVGDQRARPPLARPRLRTRADVAGLRARRGQRPALLPLRRAQPGRARPAGAQPPPALPRGEDRRRLLAAAPALLTDEERGASPRRSTARAPTSCGWGSACPSRRSGWREMRPRLDAPLLIGVGAAFDFHAGLVPQAPELDAGGRARVGLPPGPRAAPAVAALPPLQPALPRSRSRASSRLAGRRRALGSRPDALLGVRQSRVCRAASIVIPTRAPPRLPRRDAGLGGPAGPSARVPRCSSSATAPTRRRRPSRTATARACSTLERTGGANAARNAGHRRDARSTWSCSDRRRRRRRPPGWLAALLDGVRASARPRRVRRPDPSAARGRRRRAPAAASRPDHDARPRPRRSRRARSSGAPTWRSAGGRWHASGRSTRRSPARRRGGMGAPLRRRGRAHPLPGRRRARPSPHAPQTPASGRWRPRAIGRAERRAQRRAQGGAPAARTELRTLAGCAWHVARRRCAYRDRARGATPPAGCARRSRERRDAEPREDFLSGTSGQVSGIRRTASAAIADATHATPAARCASRTAGCRRAAGARSATPARAGAGRSSATTVRTCWPPRARSSNARATRSVRRGRGRRAAASSRTSTRLLAATPALGYDWLLVIDDDVALPRGFLDAFLFLAERYRLEPRSARPPGALARGLEGDSATPRERRAGDPAASRSGR